MPDNRLVSIQSSCVNHESLLFCSASRCPRVLSLPPLITRSRTTKSRIRRFLCTDSVGSSSECRRDVCIVCSITMAEVIRSADVIRSVAHRSSTDCSNSLPPDTITTMTTTTMMTIFFDQIRKESREQIRTDNAIADGRYILYIRNLYYNNYNYILIVNIPT